MPYKKADNKTRTLEEMIGIETYEDSAGAQWLIKVFSLGEQTRFFNALRVLLVNIESPQFQIYFMQRILYPFDPNIWNKVRVLIGLPAFSYKYIKKAIPARDFEKLLNAVFQANLDQDFVSYMQKLTDDVKKKTAALTN